MAIKVLVVKLVTLVLEDILFWFPGVLENSYGGQTCAGRTPIDT